MTEKIRVGSKEVEADMVDVGQSHERWNEYLLDDGSVLKIKLVLKKAYRLVNQYDAQGNPVYLVESQNILTTNSPDNLKQK